MELHCCESSFMSAVLMKVLWSFITLTTEQELGSVSASPLFSCINLNMSKRATLLYWAMLQLDLKILSASSF